MLIEEVCAPNHVCGMERRETVCDVVFGCHRSSHFTFSVKKEHREVRNCSFAKAKKSKGTDGCDHHVDVDIFLCECCQLHQGHLTASQSDCKLNKGAVCWSWVAATV